MELTNEQTTAIVNYLKSEIALEKHLKGAKRGYNPALTQAVKTEVENLKKVFPTDEVEFLTSAAYRSDLIAQFIG